MISIGSIARFLGQHGERQVLNDGCTDLGVNWTEQDQSRYHARFLVGVGMCNSIVLCL